MSQITLVKNAFANVCRGGAAALVMLLMPPFLTRILSKDAYGAWLLILQLATYVSLLDFGIQTAVGKYVAHYNELEEIEERDSVASTSLFILLGSAIIATVSIVILAWFLPNLFTGMPVAVREDAQWALLLVGGSLAVSLPFSVFGGIFIGFQRYDVPAWIIGFSKLLGGIFVILIANTSHSIVMMAMVMGLSNIASGIWQFLAFRKMKTGIQIKKNRVSKSTGKEITAYCLSLSVWTICMILVSGLDTTIIGYFDYQAVVYYSLAANLTAFVTSVHGAMISVIMPSAASMGAKKDKRALGRLLLSTTRYGVVILILTSLPLVLGARALLTLWVGASYAGNTAILLQLLVIANFVRHIGAPYAIIALAVGEQRKIILSPVIEAIVNLTASVIFTAYYGVIGVAIGTLCGAFVSIGMHFMHNLPRTMSIEIKNSRLLLSAVFVPLASVGPSVVMMAAYASIFSSIYLEYIFLVVANVICWLLLWKYGVSFDEKTKIMVAIYGKINVLQRKL